jgi:cytochrome c oxidase subunit 2
MVRARWYSAIFAGAIILLPVGTMLFRQLQQTNRGPRPGETLPSWQSPLIIKVTGRDFQWHFLYPGADSTLGTSDDVNVDKELRLPVGSDVELQLTSDDYIYFLSLPPFRIKEIAVPDLTYRMRFRTTEVDSFDLPSDPMCGLRFFHDELMGHVTIQSPSAFEAWYRNGS